MTAVEQVASQGQGLQEHTGRTCADELNRRQQLSAATDRALKDATNTMESTISSSAQLASQGDQILPVDCHRCQYKVTLWCRTRCFTVAIQDLWPQPCWVQRLVLEICNSMCLDTTWSACQQSAHQHRTMRAAVLVCCATECNCRVSEQDSHATPQADHLPDNISHATMNFCASYPRPQSHGDRCYKRAHEGTPSGRVQLLSPTSLHDSKLLSLPCASLCCV